MVYEHLLKAKNDEKWKCQECATNKHNCLLCKSSEGNVIRCSQAGCGRFYHVDCILKNGLWPQHRLAGDDTLICPVHTCHTCASDNPKDPYMKYNSKLVKCVRCPTAYHSGDYCVAAGKTFFLLFIRGGASEASGAPSYSALVRCN